MGGGWGGMESCSLQEASGWRSEGRHECVSNYPDWGWQPGPGEGLPPSAPMLPPLSLLPRGNWDSWGGIFPSCPAIRGAALDPGTQEGQGLQGTVATPTGLCPHLSRTAAQELPSEPVPGSPQPRLSSRPRALPRAGIWRLGLVRCLISLPTVGLSVHLLTSCPRLLCGLAQTGVEWATQGLTGQEGDLESGRELRGQGGEQ